MQRFSQRRGRLGLAGILERMADVVQLIGVVAVVVDLPPVCSWLCGWL